jgi:hypothetical protein
MDKRRLWIYGNAMYGLNNLYSFGGETKDDGVHVRYLATIQCYSPTTDKWRILLPDLQEARSNAIGVYIERYHGILIMAAVVLLAIWHRLNSIHLEVIAL